MTDEVDPYGGSAVTEIITKKGDDYYRGSSAGKVRTFLNVADGATNVTNNNQLTNGAGYITDGNTNWDNSYGFTTYSANQQ